MIYVRRKMPTSGPRSAQPIQIDHPRILNASQIAAAAMPPYRQLPMTPAQMDAGSRGPLAGWGDGEIITPTVVDTVADLIAGLQDPVKRAGVLQAKLDRAKEHGASKARIAVLQAKLDAAKRRAGLEVEGEQAVRSWRGLGQTAIVVGLGVGVAIIYAILRWAQAQGHRQIGART